MDPGIAGAKHFLIRGFICVRFILLELHFQSLRIRDSIPQIPAISGAKQKLIFNFKLSNQCNNCVFHPL